MSNELINNNKINNIFNDIKKLLVNNLNKVYRLLIQNAILYLNMEKNSRIQGVRVSYGNYS